MTADARIYCGTTINLLSNRDYAAAANLAGLPKFSAEQLEHMFSGSRFAPPSREAWRAESEVYADGRELIIRCPVLHVGNACITLMMTAQEGDLPSSRIQSIETRSAETVAPTETD